MTAAARLQPSLRRPDTGFAWALTSPQALAQHPGLRLGYPTVTEFLSLSATVCRARHAWTRPLGLDCVVVLNLTNPHVGWVVLLTNDISFIQNKVGWCGLVLAVVHDLREQRMPKTDEELADYETGQPRWAAPLLRFPVLSRRDELVRHPGAARSRLDRDNGPLHPRPRTHVEDAWVSGQQRATDRWKGLDR